MNNFSEKIKSILNETFGYFSFMPLQEKVIESVLSGNDTLALMPTGGGKSLCYQIPALIFSGVTVVISPLISLMQNQVSALSKRKIPAALLNSTLSIDEFLAIIKRIESGEVKLVYIAPERIMSKRIRDLFRNRVSLSLIAIDEAHCISEWGHDFRPDYLEIATFRKLFPSARILALTATATERVRTDIINSLDMHEARTFISTFNRPNIFFMVKEKPSDPFPLVVSFLEEHETESGIIYCLTRSETDALGEKLARAGFSALPYHAGLPSTEREHNQELFIRGEVKIIVATVAFGMGIDKKDVRFVLHFDIPRSLEEYYQEVGRAGRDGNPSVAFLLYSKKDSARIKRFSRTQDEKLKKSVLLRSMEKFAETKRCRRKVLLDYFGEDYKERSNCCCDNCKRGSISLERKDDVLPETGLLSSGDYTIDGEKFMSCIYRLRGRHALQYVVSVLRGEKTKRILEHNDDKLSTFGIGRNRTEQFWKRLSAALIEREFVNEIGIYKVLKLTKEGYNALVTREKIELDLS